jgi:hypothetical protein
MAQAKHTVVIINEYRSSSRSQMLLPDGVRNSAIPLAAQVEGSQRV